VATSSWERAHFWIEVLSAGLYCWDNDQIFSFLGSLETGPGRFTFGFEMSCCEAERVIATSRPPRRRIEPSDAELGSGAAALALQTVAAAITAAPAVRREGSGNSMDPTLSRVLESAGVSRNAPCLARKEMVCGDSG